MKRYAVIAAVVLLGGCQAVSEPAVRVERVEVPTPVACVEPAILADAQSGEPDRVADQLTGDAGKDLLIVSASALELRAWGTSLLGIVEGCAQNASRHPSQAAEG